MKSLFLLVAGIATLCSASSEPVVSFNSLKAVEASINDKVRSSINDPYDLLGTARGTYLEGYGALFSVELNLLLVSTPNMLPFNQKITEAEITAMRERKLRKMELLRDSMRGLMLGASKTLTGLPAGERIVMETFLFNYHWENSRGLAHRLVLTAEKQKLLDASARHLTGAELAAVFTQEEL